MRKKKRPGPRPLVLKFIEGLIAERYRLYQEQGDPLRVWEAYLAARAPHIETPHWVTAYLDRVATRLVEISKAEPTGDTLASAVLAALEIQRPGAGTVFSRRLDAQRNDELVLRVAQRRRDGEGYAAAIRHVAESHHVGEKTVERAWRAAKKLGRIIVPSNVGALRRDQYPAGIRPGTLIEFHKGPRAGKYRVTRTLEEDEHIIVVEIARIAESIPP